jgi:hypothetical protein
MANNYSGYSFAVKTPNEAAARWLENQAEENGIDTERHQKSLVLSREDSIDLEVVTEFLQLYLKKFAPKDVIGFSWAEWCDRPRVNEFGGGVVVVTVTEVVIESTSERLAKLIASSGPSAPVTPGRFVHNLAGGNNEYQRPQKPTRESRCDSDEPWMDAVSNCLLNTAWLDADYVWRYIESLHDHIDW